MDNIFLNKENRINIAIEQSDSNYLYHYTSNSGLMGIIRSDCFWVSRADFLNDSRELSYTKEILEVAISEIENSFEGIVHKKDSNGKLLKFILSQLKSALNRYSDLFLSQSENIFLLSLSENNDSLTLFSNYSNSDGYNLGFKRDRLIEQLQKNNTNIFQKGKINYNRKYQENIVINDITDAYEEFIVVLTTSFANSEEEVIRQELSKFFNLISFKLLNYSMYFKHPSFYHEEEYRIAFIIDPEDTNNRLNFRPFRSIVIPYLEVNFSEKLPIEFITIGPKNNIDIAQKGVELYLEHNGYRVEPPGNISVVKSEIPLRF